MHNWEYKAIRDICDNTKFRDAIYSKDGKYWLLNLDKIISNEGKVSEYEFYDESEILDGSVTSFGEGFVLYSKLRPNLNKVIVTQISGFCTTELVPLKPKKEINPYFLAYFLRSPIFVLFIIGKVGGAKMPRAKMADFWTYHIPVPPMEVQQQIVAELDGINGQIDRCRQLLQTLDSLATSIFYDTFGDPVTNPKSWKTKSIKEVAPSSPSSFVPEDVNGKYWLLNLDQVESNTGKILSIQLFFEDEIGNSVTTFDSENVLYSKLRPYLNKVVLPNATGYCTSELIPLRPNFNTINRHYLCMALRSPQFVNFINSKIGGAKMPRVKMDCFWAFKLPIPPLTLQQQFATQFEAIEAQKAKVEATIAELQTLLDSRMDYWFGA